MELAGVHTLRLIFTSERIWIDSRGTGSKLYSPLRGAAKAPATNIYAAALDPWSKTRFSGSTVSYAPNTVAVICAMSEVGTAIIQRKVLGAEEVTRPKLPAMFEHLPNGRETD